MIKIFYIKKIFLLIAFLGLPFSVLFAQQPQNVFAAPLAELNGYGWDSPAFGGGVSVGAGTGGALGLNLLYAMDTERFSFLEIQFFARGYIFGKDAYSGPFVQLGLGPVIYNDKKEVQSERSEQSEQQNQPTTQPATFQTTNFSAGLTTGWRFLAGRFLYIEPTIRIGYPYLIGGGVCLGIHWRSGQK